VKLTNHILQLPVVAPMLIILESHGSSLHALRRVSVRSAWLVFFIAVLCLILSGVLTIGGGIACPSAPRSASVAFGLSLVTRTALCPSLSRAVGIISSWGRLL